MLFLTPWFWVFAAVAIPVCWMCPRRLKPYWLLIASAVFHYHFAGPAGMAPIIFLGCLTYGVALAVSPRADSLRDSGGHRTAPVGPARTLPLAALVSLLLIAALAFYKYSGLFLQSGVQLFAAAGFYAPGWMKQWHTPAAPLAISFFTFEFIHYLYEVRVRGRAPIRHPIHFAVFAIFFPSLACGPIKRYPDFVPQLNDLRNPSPAQVWPAVQRLIRGLFKKVCVADLLVEYITVLEAGPHFNAPIVVLLAMLQGFRIYYDFAGYSDIAIALAQLLNLRLPENFDRPYWSSSLQEFWRRWHMSLSSWIRDYVYIPLGGNRVHRLLNLAAAMIIVGLWHGAAWHFALWGVYHGLGLALESAVRRWLPGLFGNGLVRKTLGWIICYSFVTYGWLLFFYPVGTVCKMTQEAFGWCFTY